MKPVQIQSQAPTFKGIAWSTDDGFKEVKLADYHGRYLVLLFFQLDFTFEAPTEIVAFSQNYKQFKINDCDVLACSTDSQYDHMAYTHTSLDKGGLGPIKFPLLSDITQSISRSYNSLIEEGPDAGVCIGSTYIIDRNGIIRHISQNATGVGRNVEETLRLVEAYQYVEENGVVCPTGWTKGSKFLKADCNAEENKQYWEEKSKQKACTAD